MKVRIQELKIVERDFKPLYAAFSSHEDDGDNLVALFKCRWDADLFAHERASLSRVKYYIRAVDND